MDKQKGEFIKFLLQNGLRVFDNPANDRTLKSKRISPWFLNVGDFNDGATTGVLAGAYADMIIQSGVEADLLYGIPEKGVGLVAPVAIAMAERERNIGWFFTRKVAKEHGEATGKLDITKDVVGRKPAPGSRIIQLDDVFTDGKAKYDSIRDLNKLAEGAGGAFQLALLAIALDRQEVTKQGINAIQDYSFGTKIPVVARVNALDVLQYLRQHVPVQTPNGKITKRGMERLENYLRVYGTTEAIEGIGKLNQTIVRRDRSVIPACDIETLKQFEELVKQTANVEGIGGYKIGFELGYQGLAKVVATARKHTDKPIIFDHQKAGTDIPDTGRNFARTMKNAGVDAVILFPQAGPETQRAWMYHALDYGLKLIVGGWMTHEAYAVSEGGYIEDASILRMYRIAARSGVRDFVVPGTKLDAVKQIRQVVEDEEGIKDARYYSPGLVKQGGNVADTAKTCGDRFHGIVGRDIYEAKDMREAAKRLCSMVK